MEDQLLQSPTLAAECKCVPVSLICLPFQQPQAWGALWLSGHLGSWLTKSAELCSYLLQSPFHLSLSPLQPCLLTPLCILQLLHMALSSLEKDLLWAFSGPSLALCLFVGLVNLYTCHPSRLS